MKVPNQLKIGAHTYTIVRAQLNDKLGETDHSACTITLHNDLTDSALGSTLLHEVFHACNSTLGESAMGHALLDSLAEQLYAALADNGLLAEDSP